MPATNCWPPSMRWAARRLISDFDMKDSKMRCAGGAHPGCARDARKHPMFLGIARPAQRLRSSNTSGVSHVWLTANAGTPIKRWPTCSTIAGPRCASGIFARFSTRASWRMPNPSPSNSRRTRRISTPATLLSSTPATFPACRTSTGGCGISKPAAFAYRFR